MHQIRLETVTALLKESGSERILDLGCGEGRLLHLLMRDKQFKDIIGMDVSHHSLEWAAERLKYQTMSDQERQRIKLIQSSLTHQDQRWEGYDAAALVEVIEHLDPVQLKEFERVVFGCAQPGTVIITTPNREYNVKWPSLPAGEFRHHDHHFEWTRLEFQAWARRIADTYHYTVRFMPAGPIDSEVGAPSQIGVFTR